jgi:signal transduction histidine kinase/CheY-like chemotaxis protein
MKARRALIFFFDVNHAYIMAEATQTLSLENEKTHEPDDQLWMGYSVIPREVACCEVTVNLPSFDATKAFNEHYRDNCFVVDDLTKHPDLRFRNYVTEHPHGRYYAGVPITTPAGVNIGAYCILDDKPREGISKQDLVFMHDMSQTVMTHLQTMRAMSEREQNNQMVAGLGEFVRGTSDSLQTKERQHAAKEVKLPTPNFAYRDRRASHNVQPSVPDALVDRTGASASSPLSKTAPRELEKDTARNQQDYAFGTSSSKSRIRSLAPATSEAEMTRVDVNEGQGSGEGISDSSKSHGSLPRQRTARKPDTNDENQHTYQRAAEIMCRSLGIDGVCLLDLSVNVFGGLIKPNEDHASESSMTSGSASEDPIGKETTPCLVLGCAENLSASSNKANPDQPAKVLTETLIRRLMHRNPTGKIWTFGENLTINSDDGFSTEQESADSDEGTRPQSPITKERKYARRIRRSDAESLQLAFPGARCIALHGIWDHARHRWSVAGLYWTYDPLRVISPEIEMQFVNAFCDIMVAETNRVEVVTSDKAKSDFISSVSHELRSPLHGILGSVEILMEEKLENNIATLVQQISACGNSLLEIIEHLLDFANLKHRHLKRGAVKSSKIGRRFLPNTADIPENSLEALKTGIALDDLTEDAVSSSAYSFHYHHDPKGHIQTSVILDIERFGGTEWLCKLATGGMKRIVINLVTNALKYTPAGFVHVKLERKAKPGPGRRFDAVLTVSDSGKGMSDEFQKNHLFEDFSQEDTLANGLGLGMHMVARIINAMGGKIEVTSKAGGGAGGGTRVTVTIPLENTVDPENPPADVSAVESNAFAGLRVGIVEVDHATPVSHNEVITTTTRTMAVTSIEKNLAVLGIAPERCSLTHHAAYDLNVVLDEDLAHYVQTNYETGVKYRTRRPSLLVICRNNPGAQALRRGWRDDPMNAGVTAEFIALPCGLQELKRAIASALKSPDGNTNVVADAERSDSARRDHFVSAEKILPSVASANETGADLPLRLLASPGSIDKDPSISNVVVSSRENSQVLLGQLSMASRKTSHSSENLTTAPQDSTSAVATEQRPSGPPSTMSAAQPSPGGPLLLLVDDNSINLQLLVRFAKKHRYQYITAVDGRLAFEAFENAHKESLTSPSSSSSSDTKSTVGAPGDGIPTLILMDINMPVVSFTPFSHLATLPNNHDAGIRPRRPFVLTVVSPQMDGYESVQLIRAYEKKHHLNPSKTIAVTALGSEAARAEAFGSGFDSFVSKPIKLRDLAKLIE